MFSPLTPAVFADNVRLDSSQETYFEQEIPSISASEFSNGCLEDGSLPPDEFIIRPHSGISTFSSGGYNYVYKRTSTKIIKKDAVVGAHPGIGPTRNVAFYYLSNKKASASFSFGYGGVSVSFAPMSSGVTGYSIKAVSSGYTQLRIRANVWESNDTVSVYDRYSGKLIRSYKENGKRTTEGTWYDTVKVNK